MTVQRSRQQFDEFGLDIAPTRPVRVGAMAQSQSRSKAQPMSSQDVSGRYRSEPSPHDRLKPPAKPLPRRSGWFLSRAIDAALRNPVMASGTLISGLAIIVITTNAIANQPMRHPSPLFNTRGTLASMPTPVSTMPIIVGQNPLDPVADAPPAPPAPRQLATAAEPGATSQPVEAPIAAAQPQPLANVAVLTTQRIQQSLREHGLYNGPVDGIAGAATSDAIRSFEQRMGVVPTGEANDKVLALLKSDRAKQIGLHPQVALQPVVTVKTIPVAAPVAQKPPLQLMPASVPPEPLTGTVEGRLQKVQRALNMAGYGTIRTDGHFDDKTAEAIRKFEAEHGMQITGKMSDRLAAALVVKSADAR